MIQHGQHLIFIREIQFTLPGIEKDFTCKAAVVWSRPYRKDSPSPPGYGLQFEGLTEEECEAIDEWVGQKIQSDD